MTIAVNDAGDVLTLDGGAWKPATVAVNDAGDRLALDGGAWKPVATKQPDLSTVTEYGPSATTPAPAERSPTANGIDASAGRIWDAAAQGYRDTPSILAQPTQDFLGQSPVGRQIINPAAKVVGGVNAAAHAGVAALSQAAMEVFGEKGGRDAIALLSGLPMTNGERMSPHVAEVPAEIPRPRFMNEITMPPDTVGLTPLHRALDLIRHDDMENGPGLPDRGAANQSLISEIGAAPNVDGAIAAAAKAMDAPYQPVTVRDVIARDGVDVNEAYRRTVAENAAKRSPIAAVPDAEPLPTATDPQPLSVGAAASREQTPESQIALSMDDMKANRRRAEMDELLAPPASNDNTLYVNGSFPTLAERSGDPEISQTENLLRQRNSGAFVGEGKILTENNKARVASFDAHTVPDTTLNAMRKARSDQWVADSENILPTAKPVDLTTTWDWVNNELSNPRIQENDAVRKVLEDFQDRLTGEDGNLKDDAAAVWGMHDNLQNLLAKAKDPLNMTGSEKFAESQILAAKAHIDEALNAATGNQFQTALSNYADASKAINSGVLLNDFRPKLTNMQGELQAANFHRFVTGLAKERGDPGIDPSMDISDGTMRALLNIDADLKRAGLIKLGAAAGSPTNLLGALADRVGLNAAHSALSAIPGVGAALKVGADLIAQRRMNALTAHHLAPPEGGYVPHPGLNASE